MNNGNKIVETGVKIAQQLYNSIPEKAKLDLISEFGRAPLKAGKAAYKETVKGALIEPNRSDKSLKNEVNENRDNLLNVNKKSQFYAPEMEKPFDVAKKIYGIDKGKLHEGIETAKEIQANSREKSFVKEHHEQKNINLTRGNDGNGR